MINKYYSWINPIRVIPFIFFWMLTLGCLMFILAVIFKGEENAPYFMYVIASVGIGALITKTFQPFNKYIGTLKNKQS